jgi:translation elongation factor EF-G
VAFDNLGFVEVRHSMTHISTLIPDFLVSIAVQTKVEDSEKLSRTLQVLAGNESSIHLRSDRDTGRTVVTAMSELELKDVVARLVRQIGISIELGRPQVAYKTLPRSSSVTRGSRSYNRCGFRPWLTRVR